jgi:hypothetical protein
MKINTRLASHILSSLHVEKCVLWSDSQIVLHWFSSKKQLNTFIANRIAEIKELTSEHRWKYCPTQYNPTDLLSRGIPYEELKSCTLWMRGPEWLTNEKNWPSEFTTENVLTTLGENEEDCETSSETKQIQNSVLNIIDVNRYSSFRKIVRIFAYVLRFLSNCRSKGCEKLITDYLTPNEINAATLNLVKAVQMQGYSEIFDCLASNSRHHLVRQLRLYLDSDGLIRCGGCINNAPLPDDAKCPYLLPKKNRLTSYTKSTSETKIVDSISETRSSMRYFGNALAVQKLPEKHIEHQTRLLYRKIDY